MTTAFIQKTEIFALELHEFLRELDPVRWKEEKKKNLRERFFQLEAKVNRLYNEAQEWRGELSNKVHHNSGLILLGEKLNNLRELFAELRNGHDDVPNAREYFSNLRKKMESSYQELCLAMKSNSVDLPHLRPTNYSRSFFHILSALFSLFLIIILPADKLLLPAILFAASGWTMETMKVKSPKLKTKIMSFFAPVAHPHEYDKVNSATWYATALVLLSLTQSSLICALGVIILGFADPAAATIGRKFGRTKLVYGRSLEGSLTFVVVGTLVSYLMLSYFYPLAGYQMIFVSVIAALFGAVGELFGKFPDDNFIVPISSSIGAFLALALIN